MVRGVDNENFQEEIETGKHFLVQSEMAIKRYSIFNFAMNSPKQRFLIKQFDLVFDYLKSAAMVNAAFGSAHRIVEDDSCRYYYPDGNTTLMERFKLVAPKKAPEKIKTSLNNVDVMKSCTRERPNTNRKLCKLPNVALLAAFLMQVPMSCEMLFCHNDLSEIIQSIV